jgi:hypothetical protein
LNKTVISAALRDVSNTLQAPLRLQSAQPKESPDEHQKRQWIRHMAETTGMIEPFEPAQVR